MKISPARSIETQKPFPTVRPCNKCGTGKLETRVTKHVLVKAFFFWLPLKRYRCHKCTKKTYVLVRN